VNLLLFRLFLLLARRYGLLLMKGLKMHNLIADEPTLRSRRTVLEWSGAAVATIALAGGLFPNFGISSALAADLGEGDIGILNYAYALEQLEAAFYSKAVETPYADMPDAEKQTLTEIRDHEVAHRDFLKKALGEKAIPDLEVDFSKVDFGKRDSVLNTAKTFEDLGVAAYNGAGRLLKSADYLLVAGKVVSVEARHAATIRDLLHPSTTAFAGADVVGKHGLDGALPPAKVLKAAGAFIKTEVTANSIVGMK
jgi:Ferritin-like domain